MKSFPSHSDLADRLIAMARAMPAKGLHTMVNKPFDDQYFTQPAITGVDVKNVILKRAVYDPGKKALIVSTLANNGGVNTSFKVINLDPAKTYAFTIDNILQKDIVKQPAIDIPIETTKSHDIIIQEK